MNQNIKEKIKNSHYYKYSAIAPEGYFLVSESVLEKLKDFDFWKEWKNNPELLIDFMKKKTH